MTFKKAPPKDPDSVEPYFFIFCDTHRGINDGSRKDRGRLQGAIIDEILDVFTNLPDDLVIDSFNKDAVKIRGIQYPADTVVTAWLSGGVLAPDGDPITEYEVTARIHTNDDRTLDKTMIVPIAEE